MPVSCVDITFRNIIVKYRPFLDTSHNMYIITRSDGYKINIEHVKNNHTSVK